MNWLNVIPQRIHYLSRPKINGLGRHDGVLLEWFGRWFVVDRQADKGLRIATIEEFASRRPVTVLQTLDDPREVAAAFRRLHEAIRLAPGFDMFTRNCEHFARRVVYGQDRSNQMEALLFFVLLGGAVAILASATSQ